MHSEFITKHELSPVVKLEFGQVSSAGPSENRLFCHLNKDSAMRRVMILDT